MSFIADDVEDATAEELPDKLLYVVTTYIVVAVHVSWWQRTIQCDSSDVQYLHTALLHRQICYAWRCRSIHHPLSVPRSSRKLIKIDPQLLRDAIIGSSHR